MVGQAAFLFKNAYEKLHSDQGYNSGYDLVYGSVRGLHCRWLVSRTRASSDGTAEGVAQSIYVDTASCSAVGFGHLVESQEGLETEVCLRADLLVGLQHISQGHRLVGLQPLSLRLSLHRPANNVHLNPSHASHGSSLEIAADACILFLEVLRSRQKQQFDGPTLYNLVLTSYMRARVQSHSTFGTCSSRSSCHKKAGQFVDKHSTEFWYMDLTKKEEEHSRTCSPMPTDAELMLEVETGMKMGYAYRAINGAGLTRTQLSLYPFIAGKVQNLYPRTRTCTRTRITSINGSRLKNWGGLDPYRIIEDLVFVIARFCQNRGMGILGPYPRPWRVRSGSIKFIPSGSVSGS
ncbi:hypothetical protein M9H77_03668 [Catharanthus roseus]|uniref:Uncharacterized protein n=1 Tax=Catharanthus roseus TaxID=4058 RepID=A0ACC0CC20_CATRO|nr:hypothetical protein M9H77_03668 [Catharanthus roseus]